MQHVVQPGITFSWQAQNFRQVDWKNRKTHWHEAVSSALNFPFLKEVSQNCCVFDVVKFKTWRSLAALLLFGCCLIQKIKMSRRIASFLMWPTSKLRKSRRIAAFLMLSSSNIEKVSQNCCVSDVVNKENEEISQNCFVFDAVKFKNRRGLAELLRFWRCQVQNLRMSRRIAAFSSLQKDR